LQKVPSRANPATQKNLQTCAHGEHKLHRKALEKPQFWLAVTLILLLGGGLDVSREPPNQVTARLYVSLVRCYQYVSRPHLGRYVQCRYRPSCSEYSIQAVGQRGILGGLGLTILRVCRCLGSVPLGTYDPVPDAGAAEMRGEGVEVGIISKQLGHTSVATTAPPMRLPRSSTSFFEQRELCWQRASRMTTVRSCDESLAAC